MREGWKEGVFGDIAEIIMGQSPSGETCNELGNGVPLLNGPTEFGNYHPSPVQFTTDPKKFAEIGDLLFCVRGSTTGRMNWADQRYAIGRGLAAIRHKNAKNLQPFLKGVIDYYLPMLLTEATGSTFPNVSSQQLNKLEIIVPESIETQTHIASILSALDDKIELNRQTNQTLEAIAQAIFKEWFVDFRFPHSPLEGWQTKSDGVDASLRPCPTGRVNSLQAKPASLPSWQKNSLFPFWALPKNHTLQERAKELRKQGILSEVVFWKAFKDKKKLGWDIDRQVIIGNFIVDFFIPELGLVFEIDGSSHNDKQEYDQERDVFLSSLQLKVVRISDKDVLRNIEGVWSFVTESIKNRVEELSPPRPSGTPQEGNKCEMQDSELGPIPKGWRVGKLGDVCKKSRNTIHPKEIKSDTAYVGLEHISRKSLGLISWGASGDVDSQKTHFKKYDVLFGKLRPYFHKVCIAPLDGICSTDILVIEPQNNGFFSFCLNHLFSNALITYVSSIADGTRMPRVDWNSISNYEVVLPPENLVSQFNKTTFPFYDAIIENNQQSATLAAIRDALLPKLMNGEIEV